LSCDDDTLDVTLSICDLLRGVSGSATIVGDAIVVIRETKLNKSPKKNVRIKR